MKDAQVFEHRFTRDESCAARVREWMDEIPLDLPADASLLTHELVTNAFRHGDGDKVWVTLIECEDRVFVEVIDEGLGDPRVIHPMPFAESGRGLLWVDTLAEDWGVARHGTTHVWFRLAA